MSEVFTQKDNASNFYVPSPLSSSTSQNFDGESYDSSEPTSLPPYPFHDNLETLTEGSVPNSPNCSSPLTNSNKTFTYSQSSSYDSPVLSHDHSHKDVYENVVYAGSSPGCCQRSRGVLHRSNSENRDATRQHDHSYENVRFQRGHRSELTTSSSNATPQSDRHLARSNSETRDHHSYENVHFQKNVKGRNQSEPSFEEIHIPRVTPRKRVTDFKVGGQVSSYSNGSGTTSVNKDDGPSSLGAERSPGKKTTRRMNSRSVANIPTSSASGLKTWQVSTVKQNGIGFLLSSLIKHAID